MENNEKKEGFSYTYSPRQRDEVLKIKQKYMSEGQDKLEQLKKLDRSVRSKGTAAALVVGIIGCLLLGVGMCCTMVWGASVTVFAVGIGVGLAGIALMCVSYPIYVGVTKKQKEKIAPEIIRLSEELLK